MNVIRISTKSFLAKVNPLLYIFHPAKEENKLRKLKLKCEQFFALMLPNAIDFAECENIISS